MSRHERRSFSIIDWIGSKQRVGRVNNIKIMALDEEGSILLASGASLPSGGQWAKSAIFLLQSATSGLSSMLINVGSKTAPMFIPAGLQKGGSIQIFEDFLLASGGTLPAPWGTQDTSAAGSPTLAYQNDAAGGAYTMQLATTAEVEAITMYHADQRVFDITKGPIFECRVKITRDVTGATGYTAAGDKLVFGLAGDRNATLDDIAVNAWFLLTGATNNNWYVETDDGSADNDDNDSGVDTVEATWQTLRVDCSILTNIRFFRNGVDVTPETMTIGSATGNVQPFIEVAKASATNRDHKVEIDYIAVWCQR